jgi:hypothetical protein
LSGLAAAQAVSPADFDRGAPAPAAILKTLAADAAAMPQTPAAAPAPVVPPLPHGTNKRFQKPFQAAFLNALRRLQNPKCAAFYGEGGQAKFESVDYRFMSLGQPHLNDQGIVTVVGAATFADASPIMVIVNSDGPFMNQIMIVPGTSGFQTVDMGTHLRGADFGALLLLHELGHVVGKFGPDAGNSELNRSYTAQVQKHCF